jgi:hypothetical protein
MLDTIVGGSLVNKGVVDGFKLIDDLALNQSQWHRPREVPAFLYNLENEVESNNRLLTEIITHNRKIDSLSVKMVNSSPSPCSFCSGGDHISVNYGMAIGNEGGFEWVNTINQGNFKFINNLYSNTYNPGWRNHWNFSWKQNDQPTQGSQNQGNQNFT